MKSKLVIISFTLFFFNSAYAICVPRNSSTRSPSPNTPPNSKPVSSSPKAPTSSSSSSSPKAPAPSSPAPSSPSSSPKDSTPSSPAPTASSPQKSPGSASIESSTGDGKNPLINTITSALPKPGGGGNNPGIKKICDSTDYPDVCATTLGPLAGPANDVSSVLGVAIKAGSDFAKKAIDTAAKLASNPATPADLASPIKDCKDSYDDASYNFQRASDALPQKDIGTMKTMLSAAITDVGDCQDLFEGQDSPLTPISDTLRKMASNSLAIIDLTNK